MCRLDRLFHRVCASTEQTLRDEIVRRAVDQLVVVALERRGADVTRRGELEQERALLKTRLALLQHQGSGMSVVLGAEPLFSLVDVAGLQTQMEKTTRRWRVWDSRPRRSSAG